jgi:hypothetical protein
MRYKTSNVSRDRVALALFQLSAQAGGEESQAHVKTLTWRCQCGWKHQDAA